MKKLTTTFFVLIIGVLFTSCIGDVDFDQVDDIVITPSYKVSLVHFKVFNQDFIDPVTNLEVPFIVDVTELHLFDNEVAQDNVEKIVLEFEIENTFNRDMVINYIFVDNNNTITNTISLDLPQNSITTEEVTFINAELQNLLTAENIVVIVNVQAGTNTTTNDMFIDFKSGATIDLKIENNG
jgi:hypothetical protein